MSGTKGARGADAAGVALTGRPLRIEEVEAVARAGARVRIAPEAAGAIGASRRALEALVDRGGAIYGVNTGFGSLASRRIAPDELEQLQRNLIRSHSAGAGSALPDEAVRAMLLLLVASLSRGRSAVRLTTAEAIVGLLNAGVTPIVPETGSVGASGDLAPLAHACLVLLGEGEARLGDGRVVPGGEALRGAGLRPITLGAKEGLALINGTHLMAGRAALVLADAERLFDAAVAATAMSIDACRATDAFLDARVHAARNQRGQAGVAARLRRMLEGSEIIPSHKEGDPRVQDPYSLRCAPVVLGAARELLDAARGVVEAELGAVTDNPLVFADGGAADVVSAGNFHGMPLAVQCDAVAIALAHVAGVAERRVFLMLAATDPQNPVMPHLSRHPGAESGLMITQYTAAACVNEMVGLATPASVANIPTCAGMEDYNSFGPRSVAKAARAVELARTVVAVELLCAAEALEYQRPLKSGRDVEAAHRIVREGAARLEADRPPAPDIAAIEGLIGRGRFGGLGLA